MTYSYKSTDKLEAGDHIYTPDFLVSWGGPAFGSYLFRFLSLCSLESEPCDPQEGLVDPARVEGLD